MQFAKKLSFDPKFALLIARDIPYIEITVKNHNNRKRDDAPMQPTGQDFRFLFQLLHFACS
jgi:hypothetical protein